MQSTIENHGIYTYLDIIKCLNRECPDGLKETTSSPIFASSRCGELPELQKMREILATKFGKEFEVCAVELLKNNGVNPKVLIRF